MEANDKTKREMIVFVTGSESTGKTQLTKKLSEHFAVSWIPEYARDYIAGLDTDYNIEDVEKIARQQIFEIDNHKDDKLVFFDTGLIITKIWFEKKYSVIPDWFIEVYPEYSKGHYLICNPDIPWVPDPLRENPLIREELDLIYENEIISLNCPYYRVGGIGETRINNAILSLKRWLEKE